MSPVMRHPETQFVVEMLSSDVLTCRAPGQADQQIAIADLGAVYVETNDSGPWGADVWWVLQDNTGQTRLAFPQLAAGEEAVVERLRQLPDFRLKGMNSVENRRFLCWRRDSGAQLSSSRVQHSDD
jgi:hypothetical protein